MNAHAGDVWLPLFQLQSVVVELREANVCLVKFTSLSVPNTHFWVKFSVIVFVTYERRVASVALLECLLLCYVEAPAWQRRFIARLALIINVAEVLKFSSSGATLTSFERGEGSCYCGTTLRNNRICRTLLFLFHNFLHRTTIEKNKWRLKSNVHDVLVAFATLNRVDRMEWKLQLRLNV